MENAREDYEAKCACNGSSKLQGSTPHARSHILYVRQSDSMIMDNHSKYLFLRELYTGRLHSAWHTRAAMLS
ncbi:hypothetical protein SCP_0901170 [Sparassis crispa]|uniref:Uncharacterized protein n=1 Tax=Sparassis crispa TaxID=139825 RepID=A0A401GVI8_9APHY|nr:hypothetical protein SCP_0901170 [Sparassis crispa]GBE86238.1 hypothetical protein SCP_0901170 [Sparassis crispa]